MPRNLIVFIAGALFGVGLALSGMTNPERVLGFLDVTGAWDPTLLFVMGGAVVTFGLGAFLLRTRIPAGACPSETPARPTLFTPRLFVGSAIFGIGWGIAGFCPGPALANLAAWRWQAVVFVALMAAGMILALRFFGADRA